MAAKNGHKVTLFEKNEKIGKKIFITGKGRCNVTNACDITDFFENIPTNSKFLYSAVYSFTNQDIIALLNSKSKKFTVGMIGSLNSTIETYAIAVINDRIIIFFVL